MVRSLLLWIGILAMTGLEFQFFPGHTYLASRTQLYVPMLERLDAPGYLSRDLVATNPQLSYTVYDEVSLFLHAAGRMPFKTVLMAQQAVFRIAALFGVFLLARSTGLGPFFAFLLSALVNLGSSLPGVAVCVIDPEPVPSTFAFGAALLAMGWLTRGKTLLSALSGGVALLYDPLIAAPFWIVVLAAFALDEPFRRLLRPMMPTMVVFGLLLANIAQLQPGTGGEQPLFTRISLKLMEIQKMRTPYVWISEWASRDIWNYLAIFVLSIWAATRAWPVLNRQMRWVTLGVSFCSMASVGVSYVLLDRMHLGLLARIQPSRTLVFTVAISSLLFGLAGMKGILQKAHWEAFAWFALMLITPASAGLFGFLRFTSTRMTGEFLFGAALAAIFTWILVRFGGTKRRFVLLALPVAAVFGFSVFNRPAGTNKSVNDVAGWAGQHTWGSSMFLFPDAGKSLYPGVFRAESLRPLWADWNSGAVAAYTEAGGFEWWNRWQTTMAGEFSIKVMEQSLTFPIDYYVVKNSDRLARVKAVFADRDFTVYDAQDLREAHKPLTLERITH